MSSVLAIVSKAVFEKQASRGLAIGQTWATDRYVSKNPGLQALASGGALFLVTVRPPNERLWLVAVLESPTFGDDEWVAKANAFPIADVTELVPKLRFTTGKGVTAEPGKLGMSLQTPRELTENDVALLRGTPEFLAGPPRPVERGVKARVKAWRSGRRKAPFVSVIADGIALLREADADGGAREVGSGPLDQWHRYSFNPVVRAEEIRAFESAHRVDLPADYRDFLLQVGNGGAGPDFGVNALGRVDTLLCPLGQLPLEEELRQDANDWAAMVGRLDRPFPLRKPGKDCTLMRVDGAIPLSNVGCGTWSSRPW
jgi:hypothetical protein